jgi:signal transduction histidine kinase
MASPPAPITLPLQQALLELDAWQGEPTLGHRQDLAEALGRVIGSFGVAGAYLTLSAPPLPRLRLGVGTLAGRPSRQRLQGLGRHSLRGPLVGRQLGHAWLDGEPAAVRDALSALALAVDAAWSRADARAAKRRLAVLDQAVRGIAGELSTERVLQLIVDRVRELSEAQYAALGILGAHGLIVQFMTSGVSPAERAAIGAIPRGHGLLGVIIRHGQSLRIADIAQDRRSYGFPPHHPAMHSFLGVPVRSQGRVLGNLYLTNKLTARSFSAADEQLVEMFALHAGIAIDNARLHEETQRLAIVDERDRISQDLHDSIIQSLYALGLSLEELPDLFSEEPTEAGARLERGIDSIHATIRDIRNLILDLRPAALENATLDEVIHSVGNEFRLNTMIDLELVIPDELPALTGEQAEQLLSITREALSNVARHSGATRAVLELVTGDGTLGLSIGDNGRGFDPAELRSAGHHGLSNLQSRAEALGGSLEVKSEPGAGTRIEARIPLVASADQEEQPVTAGRHGH